jgi:polyisoprenoid-binding protein YceI
MPNQTTVSSAIGVGLTLTFIGLSGPAQADTLNDVAGKYRIEPSSHVGFRVGQVGGNGINGNFRRFRGTFRIDGHDIGKSNVDFTLMPASVQTGEARVENFLRSDAIFDVATYPEIVFRSTSVTRTGPNSARVEGNLTAHGRTLKTAFIATVGQHNARNITFRVQGRLMRSAFGMDAGEPMYSNLVDLDMQFHGSR